MDELGVIGKSVGGRYNLTKFLGAGTMGAVYEATQDAVDRRVAIKLLSATVQSSKEVQDRFRLEAHAIAALNHPNSVTLYDFGFSDEINAHYMVMELLDGVTLDVLLASGELSVESTLRLVKQVADLLAIAHRAKIVHRDLKPENVMVVTTAEGILHAKVLDFGLARMFERTTEDTRLTHHGQLFGTPAYMSPEQCQNAADVGVETDVYALGVTLFEALTGTLPFPHATVPQLLMAHLSETPPALPITEDVAPEVSALVARMLAKHRENRPTAQQVSETLAAVLEGQRVPTLPPVVQQTFNKVIEPEPAGTLWAPIVAVLLVALGAIGGATAWFALRAEPAAADQMTAAIETVTAVSETVTAVSLPAAPTEQEPSEPEPEPAREVDIQPYAEELATGRAGTVAAGVSTIATAVAAQLERPIAVTRRRPEPPAPAEKPSDIRKLSGQKALYQ